ncbi:MAG: family 43 glycosylhydrolase [Polyangiaceae bacterium]
MDRRKVARAFAISIASGMFVACGSNGSVQPGSSGSGAGAGNDTGTSATVAGASSTTGSAAGGSTTGSAAGGSTTGSAAGGSTTGSAAGGSTTGSAAGSQSSATATSGSAAGSATSSGDGGADATAQQTTGGAPDGGGGNGSADASLVREGGGPGGDASSATDAASSATGNCTPAPGAVVGVFTDPVTTTNIAPPNPPGITFKDTDGNLVDAHGGGIIRVCDTFYLHGEYFLSTTTDNDFNGFSMYSSKDLATWKNEGIILPQQPSGQLGPNRKGERPHIIKCPSTGEFVLYAHSADVTYEVDKEVVYATSPTVNGMYSFKGSLLSATGAIAAHSDMSALTDGNNAYVVTESGWVYTLASDCHSWVSGNQYPAVNGTTGGSEAPTVFKAGNTFYWIGSDKTGWRANDDFYSTASDMNGPWTYQGYVAPVGKKTWMTQTTWVLPVVGTQGTVYMYWGDHWYGDQDTTAPGVHNYLTTYVFQPLVFTGTAISMPTYEISWKLDIGAGTWSAN